MFSDTYTYKEGSVQLTYSCYLIQHGGDYMLWNAGNPADKTSFGAAQVGLVQLLAELKVSPDQVKYLGISHWHQDHIGQAGDFYRSTLLIGKADWQVLTAAGPPDGPPFLAMVLPASRKFLTPWIGDGRKVEPVSGDKDVFGDGSVVMLSMPGHTPGHYALLVRLKGMGNVLLSGDLAHFRENYEASAVPIHNSNRADTLASLERFKQIAKNLQATVIIEHDPRDISKLPTFPAAGK
jgi:glyoxylase-like metal-dependent hydrolase (beta-lactamase superfamily II)